MAARSRNGGAASLSVAMTCQDEAQVLEYTFHGLHKTLGGRAFLNEIVVAYAPSMDPTLEVILSWMDRLPILAVPHPFETSGAQKNVALELCTGDWVMGMDCDLVFTTNFADRFASGFYESGNVWDFIAYFLVVDEYHAFDRPVGLTTKLWRNQYLFTHTFHEQLVGVENSEKSVDPDVVFLEHSHLQTQAMLAHRGMRWRKHNPLVKQFGPSMGPADRYVEAEYWGRTHNVPLPPHIAPMVVPRTTPILMAIDAARQTERSLAMGNEPEWVHGRPAKC